MFSRYVIKWWELRDSLADFSQRWQGIRQRRRTRALLCTFMLWFNGTGVFFRVDNFFNFALWMNKIRSLASYSRKLLCLFFREKFCKKTVYSGIELICEFAKIWLIITKTCFDSFLLFLLVWLLRKSFWKAVRRVRVSFSSFAYCSAAPCTVRVGVLRLSRNREKDLFRCLLCWNTTTIFTNVRQRATSIMRVSFTWWNFTLRK